MTYIKEKVSSKNTTSNVLVGDVIGNKTDTSLITLDESSLVSHNKALYYHIHAPAKIYPSMANPIAVTSDAVDWTLGSKAAIIGNRETTLSAADAVQVGTNGEAELARNDGTDILGTEALADGTYGIDVEIDGVSYTLSTGALVGADIDTALAALETDLQTLTSGTETIAVDTGSILITSTDSTGPTSTVRVTDAATDGFIVALETALSDTIDIVYEDGVWTGEVDIPISSDNFEVGEYIKLVDTTNYDGVYEVVGQSAGFIGIETDYTAETFAGTEIIRDCLGLPFDIHFVKISNIPTNGHYELILYAGESEEEEIGRVGFWRGSAQVKQDDNPIQIPVQNPGTKISAAMADNTTAATQVEVKVYYHEYLDYEG